MQITRELDKEFLIHCYLIYTIDTQSVLIINTPTLIINLLYHFHKANMFSDVIVLDSSTTFQTYDLISCDISCDCGHMSLLSIYLTIYYTEYEGRLQQLHYNYIHNKQTNMKMQKQKKKNIREKRNSKKKNTERRNIQYQL